MSMGVPATYRVLIVEDNPHIFEMYGYVLKKLGVETLKKHRGLEVHYAADGYAAWALLEKFSFDLVLTDLYMPVLDGFQLLDKVRATERTAAIPVVVITAGGPESVERASQKGASRVLKKPVRFVEVMEIVRSFLKIE